jgi:hypothetical protein
MRDDDNDDGSDDNDDDGDDDDHDDGNYDDDHDDGSDNSDTAKCFDHYTYSHCYFDSLHLNQSVNLIVIEGVDKYDKYIRYDNQRDTFHTYLHHNYNYSKHQK